MNYRSCKNILATPGCIKYHGYILLLTLWLVSVVVGCNCYAKSKEPTLKEEREYTYVFDLSNNDLFMELRQKEAPEIEKFISYAHSGNVKERRAGIALLVLFGDRGDEKIVDILRVACKDSDDIVSSWAKEGLGRLGLDADLPLLEQFLSEGSGGGIGVAKLASPHSIPVIRQKLGESNFKRSQALLWLLEGIKREGKKEFLSHNTDCGNEHKSYFLLLAMAGTGDRCYLPYVKKCLESKKAAPHLAAIEAIRELCTYKEAKALLWQYNKKPWLYWPVRDTLLYLKWKSNKMNSDN